MKKTLLVLLLFFAMNFGREESLETQTLFDIFVIDFNGRKETLCQHWAELPLEAQVQITQKIMANYPGAFGLQINSPMLTLPLRLRANSAQFNHDSSHIVTSSYDGTAKVWDAESGECLFTLHHDNALESAQFNHDSSLIVTASMDKTAKVWDISWLKNYSNGFLGHHPIEQALFILLLDSMAKNNKRRR